VSLASREVEATASIAARLSVSAIQILQVSSRQDRDAFIKFPWRIYEKDPAWVPPLILERKAFLNRKRHPFYQHGDAALFLARRNGEIVGRIAASDDPRYNALHQSNVGCFGLFESIDDVDVARALFRAAGDWLLAKGRDQIIGPIDYSTNYVCGLLIDGFEHPPAVLTAHNPPYYQRLCEACGFAKEVDWYAWWFSEFTKPLDRLRKIVSARAKKHGVNIRPIALKNLAAETQRIRAVYNEAWRNNWGFVPFTKAEADHMAKEMRPLIVPGGTLIAEAVGEPVGFVITIPDIHIALRKMNGRLISFGLPIGLAKLIYYRLTLRIGRMVALGVVEKYRRAGVAEALVLREIEDGFNTGELSMTLEDNVMINRFIEAMGARIYKTYRIYQKQLA
jgi:GNAT superfamily N-acetyltransferase